MYYGSGIQFRWRAGVTLQSRVGFANEKSHTLSVLGTNSLAVCRRGTSW